MCERCQELVAEATAKSEEATATAGKALQQMVVVPTKENARAVVETLTKAVGTKMAVDALSQIVQEPHQPIKFQGEDDGPPPTAH